MRVAIGLAVVASLGACASTGEARRVDRTRPVDVQDSRWRGVTFSQNGARVDTADLVRVLSETPAANPLATSGMRSSRASIGLLLLGVGLCVSVGIVEDDDTAVGLALGAIGAAGGSLYYQHRAKVRLLGAVRAYNASLPTPSPATRASPSRAGRPALSLSVAFW